MKLRIAPWIAIGLAISIGGGGSIKGMNNDKGKKVVVTSGQTVTGIPFGNAGAPMISLAALWLKAYDERVLNGSIKQATNMLGMPGVAQPLTNFKDGALDCFASALGNQFIGGLLGKEPTQATEDRKEEVAFLGAGFGFLAREGIKSMVTSQEAFRCEAYLVTLIPVCERRLDCKGFEEMSLKSIGVKAIAAGLVNTVLESNVVNDVIKSALTSTIYGDKWKERRDIAARVAGVKKILRLAVTSCVH